MPALDGHCHLSNPSLEVFPEIHLTRDAITIGEFVIPMPPGMYDAIKAQGHTRRGRGAGSELPATDPASTRSDVAAP